LTQTLVPTTDTTRTAWVEDNDETDALWAEIDETIAAANDADYIKSATPPGTNVYVTELTNGTDPVSSVNHVIEYRRRRQPTSGAARSATVELRQGYVSEGAQGTLIATLTDATVPDAFANTSYTLSGAEADAITDYTSLFLRIVAA